MRILTVENCQGDVKPPPVVGSSAGGAAVRMFPLCFHIPFPPSDCPPAAFHQDLPKVMEGKPKTPGCVTCECTSSRRADAGRGRAEPKAAFPPWLSSRGGTETADALRPALYTGRAGICSKRFKNNIPNQGKCCSLAYFSNASKSASEKEVGELSLKENFHKNLQLSLF